MKKLTLRLMTLTAAAAMAVSTVPSVSAAEYGWQDIDGRKKYFLENDEYAKGICIIDGVAYKFDNDGYFLDIYTGLCKRGYKIYYYEKGYLFKNGWLNTGGNTFYFYPDGTATVGITEINGVTYNFNSNGTLKKETAEFAAFADKTAIVTGKREKLSITVSTDNLNNEAVVGTISELHRFKNGKWYKVTPDSSFTAPEIAYSLGKSSQYGTSTPAVTLSFTPEDYKLGLGTGLYRVRIPIHSNGRTIYRYCEFNVFEGVEVTTPKTKYILSDSSKIEFTINVNKPTEIYSSESILLYRKNEKSGKWEKVNPIDEQSASTYQADAGSVLHSTLDLSRYKTSSLLSGDYRAVVGTGLSCDFMLAAPFDCTAERIETKNHIQKQILLTITNKSDREAKISYGPLYRLEGKKWVRVMPRNKFMKDLEVIVPSMTKTEKSFYLNDYYTVTNMRVGKYCVSLKDENGFVRYGYFDLD